MDNFIDEPRNSSDSPIEFVSSATMLPSHRYFLLIYFDFLAWHSQWVRRRLCPIFHFVTRQGLTSRKTWQAIKQEISVSFDASHFCFIGFSDRTALFPKVNHMFRKHHRSWIEIDGRMRGFAPNGLQPYFDIVRFSIDNTPYRLFC